MEVAGWLLGVRGCYRLHQAGGALGCVGGEAGRDVSQDA